MAKISKSLNLSIDEIEQLMLTESHVRIATLGPGADINLTPMTFGWAQGKAYIMGRGQKIANLRRNPTATILVDIGVQWLELKGVMMRGKAIVLEDAEAELADNDLAAAQANLGRKHGLEKEGKAISYQASASGKSRRWIVFTPEKIVSWNNEKL